MIMLKNLLFQIIRLKLINEFENDVLQMDIFNTTEKEYLRTKYIFIKIELLWMLNMIKISCI